MRIEWGTLAAAAATQIWGGTDRVVLTSRLESFLASKMYDLESSEVLDNFERFRRLVVTKLEKLIFQSNERGTAPRYRFSAVNSDILVPRATTSKDDLRKQIRRSIEGLSWRDFERFSAYLLTLTGVENATLFPGSKEEGIDIYGVLRIDHVLKRTMWRGVHVRVLGQAKISKIPEEKVRLFQNDLNSFRQKQGRAWRQAPDWFRKSEFPVLGFMMSVKGFNGGALKWGAKNGVILRDVDQLIEDLVNARDVPGVAPRGNTFDTIVFVESLRSAVGSLPSRRLPIP